MSWIAILLLLLLSITILFLLFLLVHCRPGHPDVPVLGCDSGQDGGVQHHRGHLHLAAPGNGAAGGQHAQLLLAVPHRYAQVAVTINWDIDEQ